MNSIIYTITDESPRLATESLLPIVKFFAAKAGIEIETKDISLAGRILAAFGLAADDLNELGKLTNDKTANIIKLPNISASIPQLKAAIAELQSKGYEISDYPENPKNEEEQKIKTKYDKIKGSAVNPVLRQGNSDRRAPLSVKQYAKNHPHSMGEWKSDFKTRVDSMQGGDFYESEKSITLSEENTFEIIFEATHNEANFGSEVSANRKAANAAPAAKQKILRKAAPLLKGEILDSAVLSKKSLSQFFENKLAEAKKSGMVFSTHLKATMMKVSDPIIFGVAFHALLKPVFEKYSAEFESLGINPNNGMGDLRKKISSSAKENEINADIEAALKNAPKLSMDFNSPSDIIIDASMPALIRRAPQNELATIPDRSYAGVYFAAVEFCKKNGAFNPATMGSVSNVGLMAQAAEEYGSHDKTFEAPDCGIIKAVGKNGETLLEQKVEKGDIFRMCQTKDIPIRDWVRLAVERAKITKTPVVFWLDENRAHDMEVKKKVEEELKNCELQFIDCVGESVPLAATACAATPSSPEIYIMNPIDATEFSMLRAREGKDAISATGNVLRDYLTDLFPILELGTSAKMLSIVLLLSGGGIFETGAGGSAPKQVEQLLNENYLRWDSLGEYFALAESFSHFAKIHNNSSAAVLAKALDLANGSILENNRTPARKLGELDNRGSHFYLALYWAQELAKQNEDLNLKKTFEPIAQNLTARENEIVAKLANVQGMRVDIGGYYFPDPEKISKVMRPVEYLQL